MIENEIKEVPLNSKKKGYFRNLPKKKKVLLIILAFAILLIISFLLYYFIWGNKKEIKKEEKHEIIIKDNYSYSNGKLTLLNENDTEIGSYTCENKDENLCYVAFESEEDNFDEEKNYYEDGKKIHTRSKFYFGKYAFIYDSKESNGLIHLYDFKENKIVADYKTIKSFYNQQITALENNYVILKNTDDKYGIYDLDGQKIITIIEPSYDYLGVIKSTIKEENNKIVYKNDSKWGIIDFKNKKLFEIDKEIKGFNDNYIKTIDDNKLYDLYDFNNNVVKESFTYIDTLNTYIVTINNNKYLEVYNSNLIPLIANPLIVKNDSYIKKNIYNSNNVRIKQEKCYDVFSINNVLTVNLFKDGDTFENSYNLLEAKTSSLYDYYSYETGTLYFYKDLEKKELLGTYSCKNKNALTDNSSSLNNCKIAKDSSDETKNLSTAIYNNRFVFIYDAPTLVTDTNPKVVLYDLVAKKSLITYQKVYTYSKEETTKNGVYYENMIKYVIAVNKDGNYGVICINDIEVTKTVNFNYRDIQKQGSYLIGKTSNNGWELIDYNGKKIITGEYMLFSLYNNLIVTIDAEKKLLLHDYENNTLIKTPVVLENITDEVNVSLGSKDEIDSYNIAVNGKNYYYNMNTGDIINE